MYRVAIGFGKRMLARISGIDVYRLGSKQALSIGFALFAVIALADWLTTYELSLNPFYLLVIILVTWHAGWKWGLLFSLLSVGNQISIGLVLGHPFSKPMYFFVVNFNKLFSSVVVVGLMARLKVLHEREKEHSRIDFLTGAMNYKGFYESLGEEMARHRRDGKSFSVAYLDCDNFKDLNDLLGHKAGDRLLISVVEILKAHMRKTDVLARLGGDEFAIVLPNTTKSNVQNIVDRLHQDLNMALAKQNYAVTVSVGVGTFSTVPESEDEVVSFADRLMYQVKAAGKNSVIYDVLGSKASKVP